jgi:hypothetical protein
MQTEFDPSVPPTWIVNIRSAVYFAAKYWWFIVPTVVLLARVCGLQWPDAFLLGLVVLIAVVAAPASFGVLVALVSRARRRRFEEHQ